MSETILDQRDRLFRLARQRGFEIRSARLSESHSSTTAGATSSGCDWCELRGQRVIFLDVAQTAAEQIAGIRSVLDETTQERPRPISMPRTRHA
ncbi:MAG: hypothetical protein AAF539_15990 [Planctomycetota bacterium]